MRKSMSGLGLFVAVLGFCFFVAPAPAALLIATADLDGDQEVPPRPTAAVGGSVLAVDTVTNRFDFALYVAGIPVSELRGAGANATPVHLHVAPPGQNGGIVVDVAHLGTISPFGTNGFKLEVENAIFGGVQGSLNGPAPEVNIASLLAGNLYVNVHTNDWPGGEVRGQLAVVPEPAAAGMLALLGITLLRRRRAEN